LALEQLGYQPNTAARALRGLPTQRLGVLVANFASPFWSAVVKGVERVAFEHGYSLLLCDSDEDPAKEEAKLRVLAGDSVDGILFGPTSDANAPLVRHLMERLPLVQVAGRIETAALDSVSFDNFAGGFEATRHLLNLGYERIALVASRLQIHPVRDRVAGYESALRSAGLDVDASLVLEASLEPEGGYAAALRLLERPQLRQPQAIVAGNHLQVFGILQAARERGIGVPDDLALIGYDDMPWSAFVDPPLTVIRQPIQEMADRATRLLLRRIEQRMQPTVSPFSLHEQYVIGIELVERRSCGSPERHLMFSASTSAPGSHIRNQTVPRLRNTGS
jgi:DNA-binding LacI/PurR family transcriptional regulator